MANGIPAWTKEALKYGGVGGGVGGAALVVWLAIAQPMREDFRDFQKKQEVVADNLAAATKESAQKMDAIREEFVKFRVEFTEWTRQVFVSRDLFDAMKAEYDRRIAALETGK